MTEVKKSGDSALSWSHPALDSICQQVPEFEGLLIVFRDAATFKWASSLVKQTLIPNSLRSGIQMSEIQLTREGLDAYEDRLAADIQDAVVAISADSDRDRINNLCARLLKLRIATIALFQHMPTRWELYFDACVEIMEERAVIRWRDGRPDKRLPFSMDIAPAQLTPNTPAKSRLYIIGDDGKIEQSLQKVIPSTACIVKAASIGAPELEEGALILYCDRWELGSSESEVQGLAKITTVFIASSSPLRADDRIACYRAGARLVFTHQPTSEELAAAILSFLFPQTKIDDPFSKLDSEITRLAARVKRETYWRSGDLNRAMPIYQPMIANHFRRAMLLEAEVVAVVVKFPTTPKEVAEAGWDGIFQRALVGTLMGALRNRDVSFVVDDRLVVIAYAVHNIAARSILRRMAAQLNELKALGAQADVIRRSAGESTNSNSEAESMFRTLFEGDLAFQPMNKFVT